MMDNGHAYLQREGGIGTIRFHHPKGNSLPGKVLSDLADAVREAGSDAHIRVVVLRSEGGRAFCGGASFDELAAVGDEEEGTRFFMGFANVINAMRTCPKLIIGRVQGRCAGGGVGLAAATDHCLATVQADVKLSELAIGIGPFVVGPAVERRMGKSAYASLAIDATRWHSAEWARQAGLFAETFPDEAGLDAAVSALSQRLADSSPDAMAELKKVLWEDAAHWDGLLPQRASISGRLLCTPHAREAVRRARLG